jgi:hypothetical protein
MTTSAQYRLASSGPAEPDPVQPPAVFYDPSGHRRVWLRVLLAGVVGTSGAFAAFVVIGLTTSHPLPWTIAHPSTESAWAVRAQDSLRPSPESGWAPSVCFR